MNNSDKRERPPATLWSSQQEDPASSGEPPVEEKLVAKCTIGMPLATSVSVASAFFSASATGSWEVHFERFNKCQQSHFKPQNTRHRH